MENLKFNDAAVDVLSRAEYLKSSMRYETAIVVAVLARINIASDVLARLGVRPSRLVGHATHFVSEDGTWLSDEELSKQSLLGCEADQLKVTSASHAQDLNNDYVGPEHLLIAAVSCSEYLTEVFLTSFNITVKDLRAKIIEKQSEPKAAIDKKYDNVRFLFRSMDVATDIQDFQYFDRMLDKCPVSSDETISNVTDRLCEWNKARIQGTGNCNGLRHSIVNEFPWLKY